MSRTAHIIWVSIGLAITAGLLITAAVWGYKMRPTNEVCMSMEYIIEDKSERLYVTESELQQVLREEKIEPVDCSTEQIQLHKIEKAIARHPMVRTAECYMTPRNEVKVRLTQRVPLLRVQVPDNTYFIDTDRKVMQARAIVRDSVLIVTGTVGVQSASHQLADFAAWLQKEPYWQEKIHHVYVQNPQMVYLYLKGDQPRVVLGPMRDYKRKLAKLRIFFENSAEATKDKHYTELDVRFRGQVIGRY